MYIDPELRDRVYQLFSLEVPKMLQTIETELVTLSLDRSAAKVNSLMRAAHSIKGGAASLGLENISQLAHQIEDIFRVLNHPELPLDRELELLLLAIYDCFNQSIVAELNGGVLSLEVQIDTQIVLAKLDEKIGHFVIAGQHLPADQLFGVDLTQSIFEVDVAQSLARLERVLLDPNCDRIVVGEFRAQSEVFTGIASLTDTPGLATIAHATIAALDRHPERAREICCFALVDFYAALEAVLTGNRANCGQISPGFAFAIAEEPQSSLELGIGDRSGDRAVSLAPTDRSAAAIELFQVEDLFDPDRLDAHRPIQPDLDSIEFGESNSLVDLAGGDRTSDLVAASLGGDELDFLLEDILSAPVTTIANPVSLRFDLVDIFDLPSCQHQLPANMEIDCLNFDLVDIFDVPSSQSYHWLERPVALPAIADPASLRFDLVDIFDLPSAPARPVTLSNIATIVADLHRQFDKLDPAIPSTFALPPKQSEPIRVKKSPKSAPSLIPQLSVRVALDRLERMNNVMGELAIERHGLAVYQEQFNDTLGRLRAKCQNFQTIGDKLRQVADTLSISAPYVAIPTQGSPDEWSLSKDLSQQFDVLELDRYTEVHYIAQATTEQLAQIEEQIEDLTLFVTQFQHRVDRQKQLLSHLRDDLMWARMLPVGEILNRFPRTIHDLSIEYNKPVDLQITGAGVLVDRAVIDKLLDPLVHLLRNAFDHGIDSPAERQAAGKPKRGSIEITAYHQGSQTTIEIADDGRGIDLAAIKAKAIALELLTPEQTETIADDRILDCLFEPGFSTAAQVTKLSGRGMGLDIVKEQIQSIKGTISIDSQRGHGTTFILRIPLTLTIAQLMVCQVGRAVYAFPADSIQKIVVPTPAQLTRQDERQIFHWRDLQIPVYDLAELLTYSMPIPERIISHTLKSSATNPDDWLAPLLLIRRGERLVALQIDRLITEQELTIKPFGKSITPPSYSYGCTILGDGVILPVLDPHTLIQVLVERPRVSIRANIPLAPAIGASVSILVVDDSVTTRQSLCLSLEKYGYTTLQAKDGQEALQILRQQHREIKAIVCDVEMPNMNGFEFLNIQRQDQTLAQIPTAMLTSRSNNKHRQVAAHLGAVAYFVKPYVEQDFMAEIVKILASK